MIEVDVYGKEFVVRKFKGAARKAKDRRPLWDFIGATMVSSIIKNFDVGGRPKWPELHTGGVSKLAKPGTSESRLRKSIDYVVVRGDEIIIGTMMGLKHAAIHQFGSEGLPGGVIRPKVAKYLRFPLYTGDWVTVSEVKIPKRPYVVVQDEDVLDIETEASKWSIRIFS